MVLQVVVLGLVTAAILAAMEYAGRRFPITGTTEIPDEPMKSVRPVSQPYWNSETEEF
jgi:hypothetical protein